MTHAITTAHSIDQPHVARDTTWARTRELFCVPSRADGTPAHYLCGNGLGPRPRAVATYIERELDEWSRRGFAAYFEAATPWIDADTNLAAHVAEIVGAHADEIALMGTVTSNLHVLLATLFRPTRDRHRIVMEARAFPSDRYAAIAHLERHGFSAADVIEWMPRAGEEHLHEDDLAEYLLREGDRVALVLLGGVNHHTGQAFDLERIAHAAHRAGALFGVDLAHAIGNIPLDLHGWDVDFAMWSHYKYLNADPGGVAGCFLHARLGARSSLPGWWGATPPARFGFASEFVPARGAPGLRQSSPPVVSLAILRAAIDAFRSVPLPRLFERQAELSGMLARAASDVQRCRMITPARHGGQISIAVSRPASEVVRDLEARGVLCTSRGPELIRVATSPLYNDEADVRAFATALSEVVG